MFELGDQVIEDIVFAMEDQEGEWVVDLETGEVVQLGAEAEGGGEEPPPELADEQRFAPPPPWSSRDGFRLMEDFMSQVRQPSARRDLGAALSRGRGVFKAFKESLAAYPEVEKAFREYKAREMRRVIASWYDELCELRGLARLGPEPEDTTDLVASDLGIKTGGCSEVERLLPPLFAGAETEALARLPAALAARELAFLRERLEREDWLAAYAENGEGGAIAAAVAIRERAAGRGIGRVVFVYVEPPFRRAGLGRALLEALADRLKAGGIEYIVFDSALAPADYGRALEASGFRPFGVRSLAQG